MSIKFFIPATKVTHTNGGLEMGLLQAVKEDGGLSERDEARLKHLESLPPNRTDINDGLNPRHVFFDEAKNFEEFENRFTEMEDDARQIEEAAELDLMDPDHYSNE